MTFETLFINADNNNKYIGGVISWLNDDFISLGQPKNHFWHNINVIMEAFDRGDAMVAVNDQRKVVGYMIWKLYDGGAEIDIVEVKKEFRKQGILNKMLADFKAHFSDIVVLTGNVLPQAEAVFTKLGWKKTTVYNGSYFLSHWYCLIKPIVPQLDALPNGCALALFSRADVENPDKPENFVDGYMVKENPAKYKLKYFQIELDDKGKLRVPLITLFEDEGYVGIYLNKKLIIDGKPKYVLGRAAYGPNLLILNRIDPPEPKLFYESGFFSQPAKEVKTQEKKTVNADDNKIAAVNVETNKHEKTHKRPRVEQLINEEKSVSSKLLTEEEKYFQPVHKKSKLEAKIDKKSCDIPTYEAAQVVAGLTIFNPVKQQVYKNEINNFHGVDNSRPPGIFK